MKNKSKVKGKSDQCHEPNGARNAVTVKIQLVEGLVPLLSQSRYIHYHSFDHVSVRL